MSIETIPEVLNALGNVADAIVTNGPKLVTACAVAAAVFPKPASGTWLATLRLWVDRVAFNVGHAKNASDVDPSS